MIDSEYLRGQTVEVYDAVKQAISNADARTLDILERLDQEHQLEYLLASSEAERMRIHRDHWAQKFSGAAKTIGAVSVVPLLAALPMMHPAMGGITAQDGVVVGTMSAVLLGAAAGLKAGATSAAESAARWVEKKAAKYADVAHVSWDSEGVERAKQAVASAASGFSSMAEKFRAADAPQKDVMAATSRLVTILASKQFGQYTGSVDGHVELVGARLKELYRKNPEAALDCEPVVVRALQAYGVDFDGVLPKAQSTISKSLSFGA